MKNWPKRYYYALALFIFGIFWAILTSISEQGAPSGAGPLSGIVFAYPIVGIVIGYLVGLIADIFKKYRV